MVFSKTEVEVAKQLFKVTLIIILLFILIILLFNGLSIVQSKYFSNNFNFVDNQTKENNIINNKKQINQAELPLSLEIPDYSIYTSINSPVSTDVKVLDNALSLSAVHYPGSGLPGVNNMLIFGHSTTFKIVKNKAYKVFNNIKEIKSGTYIYIKTESETHIYKTISVDKVSKYTSWIEFESDKPVLTLATCDSFGKASDRWVLKAEYIGLK